MSRRGEARERRRQEIVETAAQVFATKGYDGTSIQDIADAVGMLKGSLYYYIDSKEDLLAAVISEAHRVGMERVEMLERDDGDALTALRAFIDSHIANLTSNLVPSSVFFHEFRALSQDRRSDIVAKRDQYDAFLRDLVRRGQAEGTMRPDVDPKLASLAILGMMNWVYQWYRADGPSSPAELGAAFTDLVLRGLQCEHRETLR